MTITHKTSERKNFEDAKVGDVIIFVADEDAFPEALYMVIEECHIEEDDINMVSLQTGDLCHAESGERIRILDAELIVR